MLKKFIPVLLISISPVASAGIMADLNTMFMSNTTAAQTISTQDRVGVFGGSFVMRAPIKSANIVSFDPPRLDAGCGGVDLYLGSFSFINGQQLVALFRQVAANAVGLAFKAAIKAISPSLDGLLTEFQTLLQSLNNLAKNSCNMAHLLTDGADKALADAVGGDGATNNVLNTQISDMTAALASYNADINNYINQSAHLNPKAGNGIAKVLVASSTSSILGTVGLTNSDGSTDNPTDPTSLNNRILISLLGFEINAVSCTINQNGQVATAASTPGNNMGQLVCTGQNTITLDSLVKGGGAGSASSDGSMMLWQCMDPLGSTTAGVNTDPQICTQMKSVAFPYQGIKGYVNKMLFGVADTSAGSITADSIVGSFNSGGSVALSHAQVAFLKQSGVPLIGLLTKTSNQDVRTSIATQLESHITSCIAAKVGESLYKSANGIKDVAGYQIPDSSSKRIDDLRNDYLAQQEICNQRTKVINVINQLAAATSLSIRQSK